jgi:hypothetical protein
LSRSASASACLAAAPACLVDGVRPRLCIVSETGLGASITNSIEDIWAALAADYGRGGTVALEHWPASSSGGDLDEHLGAATVITFA